MRKIYTAFMICAFVWNLNAQTKSGVSYGNYIGPTFPSDSAIVFAPGIISMPDRLESGITFSPNGDEYYFGVVEINDNRASYKIYFSEYNDKQWTEQREAPFSKNANTRSPSFSVDGQRLCFVKDGDIHVVRKMSGSWSKPQILPFPFNSSSAETGYSETVDGIAYIASKRPQGYGGIDNWRVSHFPDQTIKARNPGPVLNSSSFDVSPYIAPDESFLIFGSERDGRRGRAQLYISFNKGQDEWTTPIDMNSCGAKVNNETAHHNSPSISHDGKYLFFVRHESMMDMDLYWVSVKIVDKLKAQALRQKSTQKKAKSSKAWEGM